MMAPYVEALGAWFASQGLSDSRVQAALLADTFARLVREADLDTRNELFEVVESRMRKAIK